MRPFGLAETWLATASGDLSDGSASLCAARLMESQV